MSLLSSFFSYCYGHHRDLHSFPTRRSSDLPSSHGSACTLRSQPTTACGSVPRRTTCCAALIRRPDRKSTRLNSSHGYISYAVFCLKKKKKNKIYKQQPAIQ